MKKGLAVLTSAVMATGMTMMLGADAADVTYYKSTWPYYYMKALESEDYDILRSGAVYIDRSASGGNKAVTMDMEMFIKDEKKLTEVLYCKAKIRCDELQFVSIESATVKYGCLPYAGDAMEYEPWCHDNMIGMGIRHHNIFDFSPLELTGENSDDYPIGCFKVELIKNAPDGSYEIDYPKLSDENYNVSISLADYDNELFFAADYSPRFYVHASDRALGDIDGDGTITTMDADRAMEIYSEYKSAGNVPEGEKQAADVNGDNKLDDEDIALILEYCAEYNDKTPDMTLNEFVKSK